MKIKNVKLEWYILQYDSNKRKMYMDNIFGWDGITEEIAKKIKKGSKDKWKPVTDYNSFKEYIKSDLMYYYWSKSEAEFQAGGLFSKEEGFEKIDGWFQLEPNLDNICKMIINKMEIEF